MAMKHAQERRFEEPFSIAAGEVTSIGVRVRQRLWEQMALECEAMVQHALGAGHAIPLEVIDRLDMALSAADASSGAANPGRRSSSDASREEAGGAKAPRSEMTALASLSVAHAALSQIIAPATPEAVLLTANERSTHPAWYALGPLPIVRQMLGLSILSLVVLLGVSLSPEVSTANMSQTFLTLGGYSLFVIEVVLVSAASLGSCFQNLQKINAVIADSTYNPKFESSYWTRWVMGVISGIILSQLAYEIFLTPGPANDRTVVGVPPTIGEPILALLGGYSVDVVHGILSNIINAFGSLFRGPGDARVESERRARIVAGPPLERQTTASGPDRPEARSGTGA